MDGDIHYEQAAVSIGAPSAWVSKLPFKVSSSSNGVKDGGGKGTGREIGEGGRTSKAPHSEFLVLTPRSYIAVSATEKVGLRCARSLPRSS